ncbi:MAG: VWA domain-containing protein [Desulfurococcales archaeon]|nr:VWA domain-containing protein [Desulfurococcales archaeon]
MGGAEPGEAGVAGGGFEGEDCGWAERALAALIALDPGLAGEARLEGCDEAWSITPGRVTAWRHASRLPPRIRLAQLAWAYSRSRALRLLSDVEAPPEAVMTAIEAHAQATAERLNLPGPMGLIERLLLSTALPQWRTYTPPEVAVELTSRSREWGLRGLAAKLLLRLSRPQGLELASHAPGKGRGGGRVERRSRGEGELASKAVRALRHVMPVGEGRGWLRPSKRLQALDDLLVVPGYSRRVSGTLAVYLDVSGSMEGGKWEDALKVAEALLKAFPTPQKRLVAFDDGVRLVVENPASIRDLPLAPSGGTSLYKALREFKPCHAKAIAIVSDWGLDEEDLRHTVSWLRSHAALGCRALLVTVSKTSKPPQGPWLVVAPS